MSRNMLVSLSLFGIALFLQNAMAAVGDYCSTTDNVYRRNVSLAGFSGSKQFNVTATTKYNFRYSFVDIPKCTRWTLNLDGIVNSNGKLVSLEDMEFVSAPDQFVDSDLLPCYRAPGTIPSNDLVWFDEVRQDFPVNLTNGATAAAQADGELYLNIFALFPDGGELTLMFTVEAEGCPIVEPQCEATEPQCEALHSMLMQPLQVGASIQIDADTRELVNIIAWDCSGRVGLEAEEVDQPVAGADCTSVHIDKAFLESEESCCKVGLRSGEKHNILDQSLSLRRLVRKSRRRNKDLVLILSSVNVTSIVTAKCYE